jgi:hypothetical protein
MCNIREEKKDKQPWLTRSRCERLEIIKKKGKNNDALKHTKMILLQCSHSYVQKMVLSCLQNRVRPFPLGG